MTSSWEQVCHPGEGILAPGTLAALSWTECRLRVLSCRVQEHLFAVPVTVYQLTALSPMPVLLPPACSGGPKASLQTASDLTGDRRYKSKKTVWRRVMVEGKSGNLQNSAAVDLPSGSVAAFLRLPT